MEEVPDMDDLLDEMESDLIQKVRSSQPPPTLPPTSIGMQPSGYQKASAPKTVIHVPKFDPAEDFNENMKGHVNIDTSKLPNTFQPLKYIPQEKLPVNPVSNGNTVPQIREETVEIKKAKVEVKDEPVEVTEKKVEVTDENVESKFSVRKEEFRERVPVVDEEKTEVVDESDPEPEPEEHSEVEEDTLVPETQIISNLNITVRDTEIAIPLESNGVSKENLDTEMESMLEYLNGFDDFTANAERSEGGRDNVEVVAQFAAELTEEVMTEVLKDEEIRPDVVSDSEIPENQTSEMDKKHEKYVLPDTEISKHESPEPSIPIKANEESAITDKHREDDENSEIVGIIETVEVVIESVDTEHEEDKFSNVPENTDDSETSSENGNIEIPVPSPPSPSSSENPAVPEANEEVDSHHQEMKVTMQASNADETFETEEENLGVPEDIVFEDLPPYVVEEASQEEINRPGSTDEDNDSGRARFDSSIATIHVLNESDSDDSVAPRRERRLTESELQLGKTSPYWIPDSECASCMLCNVKFTIITRRHHCRACGRVLCGSCCGEKAVLEYLQEAGKKPQAVRVCKPCSSMLARIEAHEQEEQQRRRESVTSDPDNTSDADASATAPISAPPPRGVLKTRSTTLTQGNEEEGASTSSQIPVVVPGGDSSRRSVMFRDGVRPGAPADEENPEEERSTALKPKKKSRKRTAVVKRIAELRMEDELACALPKEGSTKILVVKADSEQLKLEDSSIVLETLFNFSVVTIVLKKNLNCTVQVFNNPNFGLVWAVSTQGFAQIGLDEIFFSWTLNDQEKQKVEAEEPELDEKVAFSFLPMPVLHRISKIYTQSTEHEYAGVRRVDSRLARVNSEADPKYPLTKHILFFRPTVQAGLGNMRIPTNPFVIACFINEDELSWATALPNRLLYKLGEKYNVYPTPFVNSAGRPSLYSTDVSGTVLKVFTDFRSWSYRMRHIQGCTVSLTNDKTIIRIPKSSISDLREVLNFSRSMVAWSCDLHYDDDSLLVCEETDPGLYSTQVFAKYIGQRESTSASFIILDGGSKVNSLQVNVVEDGVAIRVQSERLETILSAINDGHDVVESSKDMEFRVEFVEDGEHLCPDNDYYPKSQIDGLSLLNKFQYGLSLERALTQVLQVQGITDYGVRMSHVYNLGDGRLQPEEEPKIYGMVEIASRECVAMLAPHIQYLIRAGIGSVSIRLFVSPYEFEYDVSSWLGLEEENSKYKQSLDQLIPILYNMIEYVPNGFEVEFVLSIVSTKPLPI